MKNMARLLSLSVIGTAIGFILLTSIAMTSSIPTILVAFIATLAYFSTIGIGYYLGYMNHKLESGGMRNNAYNNI